MDPGEDGVPTNHEDFRDEKVRRTGRVFEERAVDEGSQRGVFIENRRRLERGRCTCHGYA